MSQRPNKAAVSDAVTPSPAFAGKAIVVKRKQRPAPASIKAKILLFMKNILKVRYIIFLRSFPDNYTTNLCSITFMWQP